MMPVAVKRARDAAALLSAIECDEVQGAGAPGDLRVWYIQLLKGEDAVIYAWPESRERVARYLQNKAEGVEVRGKAIIVRGVRESVYLDPAAAWMVRVKGRGVYYTEVCRKQGKTVYVNAIYFSPRP